MKLGSSNYFNLDGWSDFNKKIHKYARYRPYDSPSAWESVRMYE